MTIVQVKPATHEMLLTQSDSWFVLFHPLTDNFGTGELCALFHCSGESRGPKMKGGRRFISAGHFTTQNGTDYGGSGSDLRWRSFYPAPFPTRVQALETLLRSGCKWLAASKLIAPMSQGCCCRAGCSSQTKRG